MYPQDRQNANAALRGQPVENSGVNAQSDNHSTVRNRHLSCKGQPRTPHPRRSVLGNKDRATRTVSYGGVAGSEVSLEYRAQAVLSPEGDWGNAGFRKRGNGKQTEKARNKLPSGIGGRNETDEKLNGRKVLASARRE